MSYPWPMQVGGLVLRDATDADIDVLLGFRNDPAVNRWLLHLGVDPVEYRRDWLALATNDANYSCVVEFEGRAVGTGFLDVVDGSGQPAVPRGTEAVIGYLVDPAYAGRGFATSTARGLLSAAFDHLGLRRVSAGCYADNAASAHILQKVGMRLEQHGREDSWHDELGWVDGLQFGMLAREWRARTAH